MTTKLKPRRKCAGLYVVEAHGRTLDVTYHEEFRGWMWRDVNDCYCYSDPCDTKRECLESAERYLTNRAANPSAWR
jgi:hypothetical protein